LGSWWLPDAVPSRVPADRGAAAADLAKIGSAISAANQTASVATTQVVSAAGDEVSAAIAALFGAHGQQYQAISAQAAAFHDQFTSTMAGNANSYAAAEASNANR
jgi:hypothetical protein